MSELANVVAEVDGALAQHAVADPGPGDLERIVGDGHRAFVIEAIREGYLLHYGEPRVFTGMDQDLRLLAGDTLYALGLERLARVGDLEAVVELSDLISLCARAEAEGRRDLIPRLWQASAERLSPAGGAGARAALASARGVGSG